MDWYEFASNPLAISALYRDVPSLSDVRIPKIHFLADRLALKIFVELPFPDLVPKRWYYQGYNTICVDLGLSRIHSFQVLKNDPLDLVTIHLRKASNGSLSFEIFDQSACIIQGHGKYLYLTVIKSKV